MKPVSNVPKVMEQELLERRGAVFHRQLIWVSGDQDWALEIAKNILELTHSKTNIWTGSPIQDIETIPLKQIRSALGREYDNAVYIANANFSLTALYTVAGTVKSNGFLILLSPDKEEWARTCKSIPSQSHGFLSLRSLFIDYFSKYLLTDKTVIKIFQADNNIKHQQFYPVSTQKNQDFRNINEPVLTDEQAEIAKTLLQRLVDPTPFLGILTAKRGRGKSWLLGWIIKKLVKSQRSIALVAPQAKSTNQVFEHLNDCRRNTLFSYHAPDSQSLITDKFNTVIIDEAAAIPVPLLNQIVKHQTHCVFATTLGGYEGSAGGFHHRFINRFHADLKERFLHLKLINPLRWYQGDCLEKTIDGLLLPVANTLQGRKSNVLNYDDLTFQRIDKTKLLENPTLAIEIHELLATAHYQTTPDDFIRQFDAKDSIIFSLTFNKIIIAAAFCIIEGGDKLIGLESAIATGERRVRGHLTPQYLAYNTTEHIFATLLCLRINRIAVSPALQNNGLGSSLIQKITQSARYDGYNLVSTSFGAKPHLLKFWEKNAFSRFKIGQKVDKASGEHSAMYLLALDESTDNLINENRELNNEKQNKKINDFICGTRNLASIREALHQMYKQQSLTKTEIHEDKLLETLAQNKNMSEAEIVEKFKLSGKKELTEVLRIKLAVF